MIKNWKYGIEELITDGNARNAVEFFIMKINRPGKYSTSPVGIFKNRRLQ